tara:strand:+ start:1183 stop:1905 length:723 start_codon:yes stop_codon:yes gene_type:complete
MRFVENFIQGVEKIEQFLHGTVDQPCYRSCPDGWSKIKLDKVHATQSMWCIAPSNYIPPKYSDCKRVMNAFGMNNQDRSDWAEKCDVHWGSCDVSCDDSCPDLYVRNGQGICKLEFRSKAGVLENETIMTDLLPNQKSRAEFAKKNGIIWSKCTQKKASLNKQPEVPLVRSTNDPNIRPDTETLKVEIPPESAAIQTPPPTPSACLEIGQLSGKERNDACLKWEKDSEFPNYRICKQQCE